MLQLVVIHPGPEDNLGLASRAGTIVTLVPGKNQFQQIDTNEHSTEIQVLSFDSVILVTRRALAYK